MRKINAFSVVIVLILGLGVVGFLYWRAEQQRPQVVFLDVGQGDAIHIRLADGFDILIDGGPDDRVIERLGEYLPFYDRTLELVVLTHPDADHVTGLVEVLERFSVDRVLTAGSSVPDKAAYQSFLEAIEQKHIESTIVGAGQRYELPGGAILRILYPTDNLPPNTPLNEQSLVMLFTFNGASFLLTGDIGSASERRLLQSGQELSADVLKIAHHGSKYSTDQAFLDAVDPDIAVISSGADNAYGHPHPETLQRLATAGITLFRTDEGGDIRCTPGVKPLRCVGLRRD